MPTVAQARQRLDTELALARKGGAKALKLIHGYGSTGAGGKLRKALRTTLEEYRKAGKIRDYIPGDRWTIFDDASRRLRDAVPELRQDSDLDQHNDGITLLVL